MSSGPRTQRSPRRLERRTPVIQPPPDVLELMPDVDGNALNGVGEDATRPPTEVMWTDPSTIAHGPLQNYMVMRAVEEPAVFEAARQEWRDPVPVADDPERDAPEQWSERVKRFALQDSEFPVELVGVTSVNAEWVFRGHEVTLPWIIVLGVAMDHGKLSTAPDYPAAVEVLEQYARGTYAARALADWIRSRGHFAEGHGGPLAGPLQMLPHALAAGFGELGKHGSIINRELGSSFRLACVVTDLPLVADSPDEFGADMFCVGCRVCTDACPPGAITPDKLLVRGVEKWYVDFDACLPYFAATHGCAVCLAVCPWSKPGAAPRLAENMARKLARRAP